ncbi:MAG TPA: branched-chain amino acid ABC transporter substrate-binding protein [Xanthobacteraceae bacterium]|nr:branched-chain amino acid ABC transporter substrate-binding protein [Xanthobacteraceae bacterium]
MNQFRLGAFVLCFGLCAGPAMAQELPVAIAAPTTGQYASFGMQLRTGAEQAVADINAAGGVLGRKLRLEVADDACDPKQARAIAEKLSGMQVAVVVGHYCSSSSIPASDAYLDGGVLQITPASTNPQFTERGMWNVFRVCGRDDQQGTIAGNYIARTFKGKNVAIVQDKSTYGKGLADEMKKALNKAGVKEKMYEAYTQGDKDFNALVSKMKANAIDVIYVGGYHTEAGLILRQMRAQGMPSQMVSGDAIATNEFWSITGAAGEGMMFTFGADPRKRPNAAAIVKKFKDKGIDPEGYTLYTYAAFQIWAAAAAQAKTIDPKKVAQTIHGGSWDTVLGPISYDAKGDITTLDYVFYRWNSKGGYDEIVDSSRS